MVFSLARRGRLFRLAGVLAVVLALAGRLGVNTAVADVRAAADLAALLDAAIPCQPDAPPAHDGAPPRDHATLALAALLAEPPPAATPAMAIPLPRGGTTGRATALPPGRAPPFVRVGAALPRGPPNPA